MMGRSERCFTGLIHLKTYGGTHKHTHRIADNFIDQAFTALFPVHKDIKLVFTSAKCKNFLPTFLFVFTFCVATFFFMQINENVNKSMWMDGNFMWQAQTT